MICMRNFITPTTQGRSLGHLAAVERKPFAQQHRSTWLIALLPVVQTRINHALQTVLPNTPCLFNSNITSKSDGTFLNVRVSCTL